MVICGIKVTHDASVAVLEDGRLRLCVEIEKLSNNQRYSELSDLTQVTDVLSLAGLTADDVDRFVVDGWFASSADGIGWLRTRSAGREITLGVASYNEQSLNVSSLSRHVFKGGLPLADRRYDYSSYMHVAGHIYGTYCSSPFARSGEAAYVLVWDGGQYPRLYFVDPRKRVLENKGYLFRFHGTIYGIMGNYFGPYARSPEQLDSYRRCVKTDGYYGGYSTAGKLMSYIALGTLWPDVVDEMFALYQNEFDLAEVREHRFEHRFMRELMARMAGRGYSDADVLLALHTFLQLLLIDGLEEKLREDARSPQNLCFTGGSALNIKWNSAIRDSGMFRAVWVPPFPNDSGSAIGAACCEMISQGGPGALEWNVYSGPAIGFGRVPPGWHGRPCDVAELAGILKSDGAPIVFLNGSAEVGPRALGNRSVFASATHPGMKGVLNRIKNREAFRPVAPICLEEYAAQVFDPGTRDPHMLFDHRVREAWKRRIPAVCHVDGTARLQTVNAKDNPAVYRLLREYHRITEIPLLCNTSANLDGCGFFPDAESAMRWGGVRHVFCDGTLFERRPPG